MDLSSDGRERSRGAADCPQGRDVRRPVQPRARARRGDRTAHLGAFPPAAERRMAARHRHLRRHGVHGRRRTRRWWRSTAAPAIPIWEARPSQPGKRFQGPMPFAAKGHDHHERQRTGRRIHRSVRRAHRKIAGGGGIRFRSRASLETKRGPAIRGETAADPSG